MMMTTTMTTTMITTIAVILTRLCFRGQIEAPEAGRRWRPIPAARAVRSRPEIAAARVVCKQSLVIAEGTPPKSHPLLGFSCTTTAAQLHNGSMQRISGDRLRRSRQELSRPPARQVGDRVHPAAQLRHPPARAGCRHPGDPVLAGASADHLDDALRPGCPAHNPAGEEPGPLADDSQIRRPTPARVSRHSRAAARRRRV